MILPPGHFLARRAILTNTADPSAPVGIIALVRWPDGRFAVVQGRDDAPFFDLAEHAEPMDRFGDERFERALTEAVENGFGVECDDRYSLEDAPSLCHAYLRGASVPSRRQMLLVTTHALKAQGARPDVAAFLDRVKSSDPGAYSEPDACEWYAAVDSAAYPILICMALLKHVDLHIGCQKVPLKEMRKRVKASSGSERSLYAAMGVLYATPRPPTASLHVACGHRALVL